MSAMTNWGKIKLFVNLTTKTSHDLPTAIHVYQNHTVLHLYEAFINIMQSFFENCKEKFCFKINSIKKAEIWEEKKRFSMYLGEIGGNVTVRAMQ